MLDDYQEVFASPRSSSASTPTRPTSAQLDQSLALLEQQKPLLRNYTSDHIGDLTSGSLWMTHAWSGDYYQMLADKPKTKYVIPKRARSAAPTRWSCFRARRTRSPRTCG